ncbi:cob(I)yrinic acid a,c-diamide adenosyltransferase, partial [Elizabethkingia meningoseptica]
DDKDCVEQLAKIQYDLFTLGSEAATPLDKIYLANGKSRLPVTIKEEDISGLEVWMDKMDESLEPLQFFILPGGGKAATFLHIARTICRRAERGMVFLNETEEVRPELIKYLNRLSDYLFIMARYVSMLDNEREEYWNPNAR